jgi:hypothetical protein
LGLERSWLIAILQGNTAKTSIDNTFACIRAGADKHDGFKLIHKASKKFRAKITINEMEQSKTDWLSKHEFLPLFFEDLTNQFIFKAHFLRFYQNE